MHRVFSPFYHSVHATRRLKSGGGASQSLKTRLGLMQRYSHRIHGRPDSIVRASPCSTLAQRRVACRATTRPRHRSSGRLTQPPPWPDSQCLLLCFYLCGCSSQCYHGYNCPCLVDLIIAIALATTAAPITPWCPPLILDFSHT